MLSTARLTVPAYALHNSCIARLTVPSRAGLLNRRSLTAKAGAGNTSGNEVPYLHTVPHLDNHNRTEIRLFHITGRDQASSAKQGGP